VVQRATLSNPTTSTNQIPSGIVDQWSTIPAMLQDLVNFVNAYLILQPEFWGYCGEKS
jgi:hypothetical protein